MSKKNQRPNKRGNYQRMLQRLRGGQCGNHTKPAPEPQAVETAAPMPEFTPRELKTDGQAHEDKPAPVVMVFQSELDYISRCILDYPRIETGGQLFGHWTAQGVPVVEYAIGPGPNANHQTTFFNQDVDYLVRVGQTLIERYGLQHIGEWHSHHQLGLAHPSGHDASTMVNNIARRHLRRFLLCIGNCDGRGSSTLNAFTFHEDHNYQYVHAPWHVMPELESPYRSRIDRELEHMLCHPDTRVPRMGGMLLSQHQAKPNYDSSYWLTGKANNLVLKRIIEQLQELDPSSSCTVQPKLDERQHLHLLVERATQHEHIYFPAMFPTAPPVITITPAAAEHYPGANAPDAASDKASATQGIQWNYQGDIYRAFIDYYRQIF